LNARKGVKLESVAHKKSKESNAIHTHNVQKYKKEYHFEPDASFSCAITTTFGEELEALLREILIRFLPPLLHPIRSPKPDDEYSYNDRTDIFSINGKFDSKEHDNRYYEISSEMTNALTNE